MVHHLGRPRHNELSRLIRLHSYMPLAEVCRRVQVSAATARRDLAALVKDHRIKRSYGGALVDFDRRFPSFSQRRHRALGSKRRVAKITLGLIQPGMTLFFDVGTTVYTSAEALPAHPVTEVTTVTNNLPVAEALAEVKGIGVQIVGGEFLVRQSAFIGPQAERCLGLWQFDLAFLGAEGMTSAGLWNSQADIMTFQRKVAGLSQGALWCLDASKLGRNSSVFLLPWPRVDGLLTDATSKQLARAGIVLDPERLFNSTAASKEGRKS
jgi:DeoR/GlpR family transcriptional regulator of sugar metabolism